MASSTEILVYITNSSECGRETFIAPHSSFSHSILRYYLCISLSKLSPSPDSLISFVRKLDVIITFNNALYKEKKCYAQYIEPPFNFFNGFCSHMCMNCRPFIENFHFVLISYDALCVIFLNKKCSLAQVPNTKIHQPTQ